MARVLARLRCRNGADFWREPTKTPFFDQKEMGRIAEVGRGKEVTEIRAANCVQSQRPACGKTEDSEWRKRAFRHAGLLIDRYALLQKGGFVSTNP